MAETWPYVAVSCGAESVNVAVSGTQWDTPRDAVLRPAPGLPPTTPTRRNGSRARQALAPYIDHALDVA